MNKRTFASILILVISLLASTAIKAQPFSDAPKFDPYLPGELNERALYALEDQDISTARILLERAYRLNPHSPDIKANLEVVRKIDQKNTPIQVEGKVVYLDALGNTVTPETPLDSPALWPASKP